MSIPMMVLLLLVLATCAMFAYRKFVAREEDDLVHLGEGSMQHAAKQEALARTLIQLDRFAKILIAVTVLYGHSDLSNAAKWSRNFLTPATESLQPRRAWRRAGLRCLTGFGDELNAAACFHVAKRHRETFAVIPGVELVFVMPAGPVAGFTR